MSTVYVEDLAVGDTIPRWTLETHLEHWNRFAAVNDEFVDIHMDDEAGRAALNEPGAFGMGNLRYSYLFNALRRWLGDNADIREVGCQFRAINQKNDELTVTGTITDVAVVDGEYRVTLQMDVVNQDGKSTCPARAVVVVPSRSPSVQETSPRDN